MKKETIKIFFACSINSFSTQKKDFEDFFEFLNKKYTDNKQDLIVKYEWCDSLEREDSIFKRMSRHNADIVVYLIDRDIERNNKLLRDLKKNVQNRSHKILIYTPEGISKPVEEEIEKNLKDNSLKFAPIKEIKVLQNCIEYNISLMQRNFKKINIYISCSTKNEYLNNQKKKITELCADLNDEYSEKKDNVNIKAVGYDDPESRDEVFKDFTQKTADIVVFLVDKDCKDDRRKRLEEELEYVCSSYEKNAFPYILVYLSKDCDRHLKVEIETLLKQYKLDTKTLNDDVSEPVKEEIRKALKRNGFSEDNLNNSLLAGVEGNIRKYINSYKFLNQIREFKKEKRKFWVAIMALIFGIIVIFAILKKYNEASQPRLLIAGGGSAKNLINFEYLNEGDTNKNDILEKIAEHWIYAPIPSENAYLLIMEEAKMGIGDYEKRNYYPIILSASKAVDSSFWKDSKLDFRNVGIIIGIHVGNDSLVVYSSPTINGSPVADLSMREQLLEVIKDTTIQLFTTNAGSGTLRSYLNFLGKEELNPNPEQQQVFYETDSITDTNWIALGSKSYHPKISSKDLSFTIDTLEKQVYIYFLKYKSVKNANYELPEATKKFLEKIHINDSLIVSIQNLQPDKKDTTILFDTFCAYKFHDKSHTHFNK